jgi:hypothetical protein
MMLGEIRQGVVGHLGVDGRVGCGGRDRGHAQRITIRRRLGCFIGTHHTAAAGLVFNQHGLAQRLAQRLRDDARHDVRGAAGCKRHLQLDHLGRVSLSQRRTGAGDERQRGSRSNGE